MRYTKFLGHAIFIIHLVSAIFFVYERTLYADTANFIFHMINEGSFAIGAERYSSVFPQVLPLAMIKLGLPLKWILYGFSVSYPLFYYGLFWVVTYKLKNVPIGLAIALSLFLCVDHNYFMIIFEMTQGVVWCFVLFAFLNRYYEERFLSSIGFSVVSFLLIGICFLNHPAAVFSIVFVLVYVVIDKKKYTDIKPYLFVAVLMVMVVMKAMLIKSDSYEGSFMNQFAAFGTLLPNLINLYSTNFFATYFMSLYLFPTVVLLWVFIGYFRQKAYLKIGLIAASVLFFLVITLLLFHSGDSDMMMERVFIQLSVFILIPFMHEFYESYNKVLAVKVFFIIVVVVSTNRLVDKGFFYRQRIDYIESIVTAHRQSNQAKFILSTKKINPDIVLVQWAFSMETLLYSSINGTEYGKTFYITENPTELEYDKEDNDLFLWTSFWQSRKASGLNARYFKLPEQGYVVLE